MATTIFKCVWNKHALFHCKGSKRARTSRVGNRVANLLNPLGKKALERLIFITYLPVRWYVRTALYSEMFVQACPYLKLRYLALVRLIFALTQIEGACEIP